MVFSSTALSALLLIIRSSTSGELGFRRGVSTPLLGDFTSSAALHLPKKGEQITNFCWIYNESVAWTAVEHVVYLSWWAARMC
ncbi:hypothetical protein CASFOL_029250 [Castilleja foliolosa]|uniref:Secreted protein n=1 Tax=Castilleja foliolosa TaxID=1961234 RepID=A0ABD3CDH2_9LAMI